MPKKSSISSSSSTPSPSKVNITPTVKSSQENLRSSLKIFAVLLVLSMFVLSGLFIYAIIEPQSAVGKYIDTQSPVADLLSLGNDKSKPTSPDTTTTINSNEENSNSAEEKPSPVNQILGLDTEPENFAFASVAGSMTVTETVEKVLPSVISIRVSQGRENVFGAASAGSGFFVSTDGLIVTNKHVISLACGTGGRGVTINGLTQDQKAYNLELLSVDPIEDIAILRALPEEEDVQFPALEIADSSTLQLGSEVIAIGNTLGALQNTVTKGIVSGLDRTLGGETPFDECTRRTTLPESLIQTDAAINQGNSGGPLFNASGQLIGMNTYGIPQAQNIGLAIPSVRIRAALQSYQKNGQIVRPRLGILSSSITPIDKAENEWLPVDYGELIFGGSFGTSAITPGSAADEAGLSEGDIILEVNGNRIQASSSTPSPLRSVILNLQAEDNITLTVLKATGSESGVFQYADEPTTVDVTLGGTSFELTNAQEN